jgi:hypothetical protein
MTMRKGRPVRGGLRDPWTADLIQSNGQRPVDRPETIEQAKRWDVQKSRAIARGLCEVCASQYAWGLQIGFTHSNPPCGKCAVIVNASSGEVRPNGWRNMRLRDAGTDDTGERLRAYRSRNVTPEKYVHGYGSCRCGAFWTGYETSHCSSCHTTFTTERAFDAHRVRGRCQDPESRGLVKVTRAHWVGWSRPADRG